MEFGEAKADKMARTDKTKKQWSLVDFKSLEPLVEALEHGAEKYSRDQWKEGLSRNELLDACMRHLIAVVDGEEIDQDSGVHHIGCLMAEAMFYMYHYRKTVENGRSRVTSEPDWVPPHLNGSHRH